MAIIAIFLYTISLKNSLRAVKPFNYSLANPEYQIRPYVVMEIVMEEFCCIYL